MARSDRLFRLLQTMRELPAPFTAARLASETGVSQRSLYRDIDSLRAAGARIEGERGFGYRLVEDYSLPPQTFDKMEIEALALGLAEVLHMGDPALVKAATAVMAKVAATLPDEGEQHLFHAVSQVYRLESRYPPSPDLNTIRQGCWREEAVAIRYTDKERCCHRANDAPARHRLSRPQADGPGVVLSAQVPFACSRLIACRLQTWQAKAFGPGGCRCCGPISLNSGHRDKVRTRSGWVVSHRLA